MCCSSDHCTVIDDYCKKIIVALQSSTVWGYKDNGSHVQKNNIKWSLDLSKLKHEARQAHRIWSNNGRIKYGTLHESVVQCRKRYKLEIKRTKDRQRQRQSDYVESLLDNNDVNFWKQWKKVKKKPQNVKTVNANIQLAHGLWNNFSKKYIGSKENTDLFKEFMYNYDLMGKEYANDNEKVLMHFSIEEIEKGVNGLNLRRAGNRNDLYRTCHTCTPHNLSSFCALFAIIIKHGHVLDDFKQGVIIPVIKDNRK